MQVTLPYGKEKIVTEEVLDENLYFVVNRDEMPVYKSGEETKKSASSGVKKYCP
jgi:hypothetical protein